MKKEDFKNVTKESYKKCLQIIEKGGDCSCYPCSNCPFLYATKYCNANNAENAKKFAELYKDEFGEKEYELSDFTPDFSISEAEAIRLAVRNLEAVLEQYDIRLISVKGEKLNRRIK